MKRRTLLKIAAGLGVLASVPYSLWQGLRYPRLTLERDPKPSTIDNDLVNIDLVDCFQLRHAQANSDIAVRAYAPEPSLAINQAQQDFILSVNNIARNASLVSNVSVSEQQQGITRIIKIPKTMQPISLEWKLPADMENFNFTAIGDSGGDKELEWCIKRAHQLNSQFFLHLGDLNYADGDYENCIKLFHNAPIPCYVTPGNHDFNDSGIVIDKFIDEIGPMNNSFSINGFKFINLDTAASFLPVRGGSRADLIDSIVNDKTQYTDSIVFSHRPFYDPRPDEDHDLGNDSERDWLIENLKKAKIDTVLFGHIHIFNETVFKGIRSIIAGEGLAHSDLIVQKQIAKIVLGQVTKGQKVNYVFEDLLMPLEYHCHPRVKQFINDFPDHPTAKKLAGKCLTDT